MHRLYLAGQYIVVSNLTNKICLSIGALKFELSNFFIKVTVRDTLQVIHSSVWIPGQGKGQLLS